MRHRNSGSKLGRQPAHRRATLRNLVTNVIERERITTTIRRAKETRPLVEQMITLGKRDSLHARRQAAAYLMTPSATQKAFPGHRTALWRSVRRIHAHHPCGIPHWRWRATGHSRTTRLQTEEAGPQGPGKPEAKPEKESGEDAKS